ncbi:MAG: HAD family hydrolase [Bacilli bacterium]|nr:HAD family hydrolase [Bacilli bacterium]
MIKRIILDEDNTLIPWHNEYINSYGYALDELGIEHTDKDIYDIDDAVDKYEQYFNMYDRKKMNDFVNERVNIDLPDNFIDIAIKYLAKCYKEEDKSISKVLEYLSSKYELVVLSNWFRENQESRLKDLGLDKYFTDMVFTDEVLNKPNKEAFIKACADKSPDECIMVGDNFDVDIIGAVNAGIKAILIDPNDKYEYENKIKNINELEELL